MGQALAIDWNEVRTLALAIGVREAARRMELPEETVKRRCTREGWLTKRDQTEHEAEQSRAVVRVSQGLSPVVPKAADILGEMKEKTRASFGIAAQKVAEHAAQQPVDDLLRGSEDYSRWVTNADRIHGYSRDGQSGNTTVVNIGFLGPVQE